MRTHHFKGLVSSLFAIVLAGLFLVVPANYAQQDINTLHLDRVPKKVGNHGDYSNQGREGCAGRV